VFPVGGVGKLFPQFHRILHMKHCKGIAGDLIEELILIRCPVQSDENEIARAQDTQYQEYDSQRDRTFFGDIHNLIPDVKVILGDISPDRESKLNKFQPVAGRGRWEIFQK
jgi:hypothetical protein